MIKNASRLAAASLVAWGLAACEPKPRYPGALQGVIEFDERVLGFEVGGRVLTVNTRRGAPVRAGELLATLDDTLERTARDGREAQASAARAAVALVRAGARPEEVRAMQARLRATRASEEQLEKNLARERRLLEEGAVARAPVDDLESRLHAATAERQSIEQQVRELTLGARRQEIERAEAEAAAAGSEVKLGEERVSRYALRALLDGRVLDVHADPSEVVSAGAPVFTVADTKHPYADVFVPEGELGAMRVGSHAAIHVDAAAQPFAGEVENIGRKTEFTPRYLFSERERKNLVVRVRVRIDDPEEKLHAGVPAFVFVDGVGRPAGGP